jgi:DNA topoisomerase-1
LFSVTLDEARALLAQPKARGRRTAAAPPLRELGNDPTTGKPMVVKDGRFGPYVTDGETNASLRRGDSVDQLTVERGAELLAERRARGPATKSTARKAAPGQAAARKAAPRKAAKKAPTKKAPTS